MSMASSSSTPVSGASNVVVGGGELLAGGAAVTAVVLADVEVSAGEPPPHPVNAKAATTTAAFPYEGRA